MEVNLLLVKNPAQFNNSFEQIVNTKLPAEEADVFSQFSEVYLRCFPIEEWLGREMEDLFAYCYGLWRELRHVNGHGNGTVNGNAAVNGSAALNNSAVISSANNNSAANNGAISNSSDKNSTHTALPRVEVFNPSIESHGWECGRTVILVHQRDMAFLVDSIRMELNRREIPIHVIKSTVMHVLRTPGAEPHFHEATRSCEAKASEGLVKEAVIYLEISRHSDEAMLAEIKRSLLVVLSDVDNVVSSYASVVSHLEEAVSELAHCKGAQKQETLDFLQWLRASNFTFLGYREYDFVQGQSGRALHEIVDARLGIFKKLEPETLPLSDKSFSEGMKAFHSNEDVCACFSKSATRSNVHRAVYPDYIVVKKFNAQGEVTGERRFLGLYTYAVYNVSTWQIPILRHKVEEVLNRSGWETSGHDGKSLKRIIESFPRDELFQTDIDTLHKNMMTVASINERHVVRLIMRRDPFGSFVNCLVYIPRDNFNTQVRLKVESRIGRALNSDQLDSTTFSSESTLVRLQLIYRVDTDKAIEYDLGELEASIADIARTWSDKLRSAMVEAHGEAKGYAAYSRYHNAFSQGYQESFDARTAVGDIEQLESLGSEAAISMNLFRQVGTQEDCMRFKVMHLNTQLELSEVVPILENLGLRVLGEHPYKIIRPDGAVVWLHDFSLLLGSNLSIDVSAVAALFKQAFESVWRGLGESDAFNRLVLGARLNWREVSLLRCYAGYMKQTGFNSEQSFIADTLVSHTEVTRNIVALFKAAFDPRLNKNEEDGQDSSRIERLRQKILDSLDSINNLNEDRVLRRYLDLINGTLRTNYFQSAEGDAKRYISLKLSPRTIPDIPEPRPMFEVYVYSPRMEGVHLRGGKVARGGLRWSDRLQDYRTEVLGLVKAQQVKNAVIVPTGAKGGFVCKQLSGAKDRDAFLKEGIACYRLFIQGLLDITDNLSQGEVIPPENVLRKDEDDPYLVVAADKGTATFSDIANKISKQYQHWLGDAFASGGSVGYDHKGMGITARGAWVSVQRHFRERGLNTQEQDFSVVGIGDMAGDVFGNGMLLSQHICLVGAFNHMHIFVDPQPQSLESYQERKRLFEVPRSTWADYDTALISKGGGVFLRSAKYIDINPEMQRVFGITETRLTPNALISAMLKAEVDLIWNGGIGTYVKASWESHSDVGDKSNDGLRVDGSELRCKVFGEGGNLGLSQLGRVEYSLNGGACNTDFIDNAAGVDCSDHEVNIKILLDELIASGDLTGKQRNQLLESMTDTVADLVLDNNYRQTQAISVAEYDVLNRIKEYQRFIQYLEGCGRLDRQLEFLPSDEQITERIANGNALTRPELSVLICYAKMTAKEELVDTDIAEDSYVAQELSKAFPAVLQDKYKTELYSHRLRKELVATQVANELVNTMGITGCHRLIEATGASYADIARAFIISRDVFDVQSFMAYIESLDHKVEASFQYELIANMVRRVRRGTRWFLRNQGDAVGDIEEEIGFFKAGISEFYALLDTLISGVARDDWQIEKERLEQLSLSESWATRMAMPANLFSGIGIVQAAREAKVGVAAIAEIYFELLNRLGLNGFATQLTDVKVDSYWQALARETYIDEVESHLRRLTVVLYGQHQGQEGDKKQGLTVFLDAWAAKHSVAIQRWLRMVNQVQANALTDYAMFAVALRELNDLSHAAIEG